MRHRCRCAVSRITRIRLFPLFFQNGCSQSSRFPTAGQGERSSGNEIGNALDCLNFVQDLHSFVAYSCGAQFLCWCMFIQWGSLRKELHYFPLTAISKMQEMASWGMYLNFFPQISMPLDPPRGSHLQHGYARSKTTFVSLTGLESLKLAFLKFKYNSTIYYYYYYYYY